jgi:hypothetical protein
LEPIEAGNIEERQSSRLPVLQWIKSALELDNWHCGILYELHFADPASMFFLAELFIHLVQQKVSTVRLIIAAVCGLHRKDNKVNVRPVKAKLRRMTSIYVKINSELLR